MPPIAPFAAVGLQLFGFSLRRLRSSAAVICCSLVFNVPHVQGRSSVVSEPGAGIWGSLGGQHYYVGKHAWVVSKLNTTTAAARMPALAVAGHSAAGTLHSDGGVSGGADVSDRGTGGMPAAVVISEPLEVQQGCSSLWVGADGLGVLGVIAAKDRLREETPNVVAALQSRGLRWVRSL
jgi:cation transport ATPase